MEYLFKDEEEVKNISKILERLSDNLILKDQIRDRFDAIKVKQNQEYIRMILREDKLAKENVLKVFSTIKEVVEEKKSTLEITETLINEKFGNIEPVLEHLFDFAKPNYLKRIESEFSETLAAEKADQQQSF